MTDISHWTAGVVVACAAVAARVALLAAEPASAQAAEPAPATAAEPSPRSGDALLAEYFQRETQRLAGGGLAEIQTLAEWEALRPRLRQQLFEMLSLDPLPERTELKATITGQVDHPQFVVENLHFQSRPGLYVTANLYLPKERMGPCPAVLYLCGHGQVKIDGVSYGNKTHYQHHGAWLARHGFVCLMLDTLQLGEIEGLHHGTYRERMWWWNSRGYTPAGVEAWNAIRALDYLQTRPEVDPSRLGVTGRSGGGAYSWWLAALDERIQAAVPVAGITDLTDHVVGGCVEGHCDCMYLVNTYRWDYGLVAALVAPRPLLIANTDRDGIFPLGGVQRIHAQVEHIYRLYGAEAKLGLAITPGPHQDTQELQVPAFRWFLRHLKGQDVPAEGIVERLFTPQQLKVFVDLPADAENQRIHETFVPLAATPDGMGDPDELRLQLLDKTYRGWPSPTAAPLATPAYAFETPILRFAAYDFESQPSVPLRLIVLSPVVEATGPVEIEVLDEDGWQTYAKVLAQIGGDRFPDAPQPPTVVAADGAASPPPLDTSPEDGLLAAMLLPTMGKRVLVTPRGVGRTAWDPAETAQVQNRRRFMLLGQTLSGMQVYDVRRALQVLPASEGLADVPVCLVARGDMAVIALYAAIFEPRVVQLELSDLPTSHAIGPDLLNVLRVLDLPQAVELARTRAQVNLSESAGR